MTLDKKFYLDIDEDASVWKHATGKRSVKVKEFRTLTEAMAFVDRENTNYFEGKG